MKTILKHANKKRNFSGSNLLNLLNITKINLNSLLASIPYSYNNIYLPKKNGGFRNIKAPNEDLKLIQRLIISEILETVDLPDCVYGISENHSIIENAKLHSKNEYLINLDIKNFFPSVHWSIIKKIFLELGFSEEDSKILCQLTTFDFELPQGAPTSPYLSNLALNNLDYRFLNLCKSKGLLYSRYFDDISISGDKKVPKLKSLFLNIIKTEGYIVKNEKIMEFFSLEKEKEVTGIIILPDGTLTIKNKEKLFKYIEELKSKGFGRLNLPEKNKKILKGKISFLKSVNKEEGKSLELLFNKLFG